MKLLLATALIALAGFAAAAGAQSALTLDRPSVVVVFTPDAEVSTSDRNSEGFDDFIDDFNFYRTKLASELRGNKDVAFINSSAETVTFKGAEHAPITRKSLSGYGFIIYVPGKPPTVFRGVETDSDLLCALQHLAPNINVAQRCAA